MENDNSKLKILYLLDYLEKYSSEEHKLTISDMQEMLASHHITCDRKTLYSYLQALEDYGIDLHKVAGKYAGYYIGERRFRLSEVRLLIDAVQSSRYLTDRMSRELIRKLCTLRGDMNGEAVKGGFMISGRIKTMNESIYDNVDKIQDAIRSGRQITFRYFDWGLDGKPVYRDKNYTASPYGITQDNENCYLLALSPRHGITSYRIDRMSNIRICSEKRVPCPELTGPALNEYAESMFQMYTGDPVDVRIRFHKDLTNAVIDRFRGKTILMPDEKDSEYFTCTLKVAMSPMFFSWIIGFGDKAQITSPRNAVDACRDYLKKVLAVYEGTCEPCPKEG